MRWSFVPEQKDWIWKRERDKSFLAVDQLVWRKRETKVFWPLTSRFGGRERQKFLGR
jgi:hypothetical protein